MPHLNNHIKDQLQLHFIVFIWGFTALLGKYIQADAIALVWNRTWITAVGIGLFMLWSKYSFKASRKDLLWMAFGGLLIALHWITFFGAIKVANISITLAALSAGAFATAILTPIFTSKKVDWTELLLGAAVIAGISIIFFEEPKAGEVHTLSLLGLGWNNYQWGLIIGLISTVLSASFAILNARLVNTVDSPTSITFYELLTANLWITLLWPLAANYFPVKFFPESNGDWIPLILLALLCTAYPFIKSVELLKRLTPFSVMLTINMEPVYGIFMAALIFGADETMDLQFYLGVAIIIGTVILNGIIKAKKRAGKV